MGISRRYSPRFARRTAQQLHARPPGQKTEKLPRHRRPQHAGPGGSRKAWGASSIAAASTSARRQGRHQGAPPPARALRTVRDGGTPQRASDGQRTTARAAEGWCRATNGLRDVLTPRDVGDAHRAGRCSAALHLDAGKALKHLADGEAVLLVEAGRRAASGDLSVVRLEQSGNAELHWERYVSKLMVTPPYREVTLPRCPAGRDMIAREDLHRHAGIERVLVAGADEDDVVDRPRIGAPPDAITTPPPRPPRLDLDQHVVDRASWPALAKECRRGRAGAHGREEGRGMPRTSPGRRGDDRQLAGARALGGGGTAAHRARPASPRPLLFFCFFFGRAASCSARRRRANGSIG